METINHEYYVSLEVAKLLAEVGFDWECKTYYDTSIYRDEIIIEDELRDYNFMNGSIRFSAPTLDVAQRWLRKTHHLHITIFSSSQESWMFRITKQHEKLENGAYGEDFYTYEEAQEAGIKKALELILEKGE